MRIPALAPALLLILVMAAPRADAGPWVDPGNTGLRHDIQLLADAGIIKGPVTQWPLSWGDILAVGDARPVDLSPAEAGALARLVRLARSERAVGDWRPSARLSGGTEGRTLRDFEATPREAAEVELGIEWTGARAALRLQGQFAADPEDDREWRADGSYAGIALGNWMVAAAMTDRWWGPGWQSSMILSNNARPIPAFTIDRNSTAPFESKWLRWIGHWDLVALWGFLEDGRDIPNARYFGLRTTVRPASFLEFGLSRTAMWCGSGRPCDFDTFTDLLLGRDNSGDNVDPEDEPGNQLGGYDVRLSAAGLGVPVAVYTQRIGEDEDNLLPSLFLTQVGIEAWGQAGDLGSLRVYLEVADTLCGGNITGSGVPNCAYNHPIYSTGMRYRGRAIGHTADNDAEIWSLGVLLNDADDHSWALTLSAGDLNREGEPDLANTVTPVKQEYVGASLVHSRSLPVGTLRAGLGFESRDTPSTGATDEDWRLFLEWRQQW